MKKVLGLLIIILLSATVFLTTKSVEQSGNVQLADVAKMNTANAECMSWAFNQGWCSWVSGNCYWDPYSYDCDPFHF